MKEYVVPLSDAIAQNKVHQKYIARHNSMSELSFLEWLRSVDHIKPNGVPYKRGESTLVSVKMVSPFKDEYFFQHILMNFAHCTHTDLYHDQHAHLPNQMLKMPELWGDDKRITAHFQTDGNKQYYVETLQCHISSLRDVLRLWEREVITSNKSFSSEFATPEIYPLDNFQSAIYQQVMMAMVIHDCSYDNTHYYGICDEVVGDDNDVNNDNDDNLLMMNKKNTLKFLHFIVTAMIGISLC